MSESNSNDDTFRIKWVGTDTAYGFIDSQRGIRFNRPGTVKRVSSEVVREYISGPSANGFDPIDGVPDTINIDDDSGGDVEAALEETANAAEAVGDSVRRAGDSLEPAATDPPTTDAPTTLEDLAGVGPAKADALRDAGYSDVPSLQNLSVEELAAVEGFSEPLAESVSGQLGQPFADDTV